jgi:hypothetical protein
MKKITFLSSLTLLYSNVAFCAPLANVKTEPTITATWISFLPVILFVLVLLGSFIGLKRNGIKLSNMLAEKDKDAVASAAANQNDSPPASVSRYIVFLSGLTALILSVCLSTFYMYEYFVDPSAPVSLSNLSTVIYGLGIGILPYGFNKVASGIKG